MPRAITRKEFLAITGAALVGCGDDSEGAGGAGSGATAPAATGPGTGGGTPSAASGATGASGVTTGATGASTGSGGPVDDFVLRVTKPDATNTGAGILRPYPTTVIEGNVTLVDDESLLDTIVHGQVICKGTNLIENCVVTGGAAFTQGGWLIQCYEAAQATIRFTTVRPTNPSLWTNGIGLRNYLAYRCNVSGTVDCFSSAAKMDGGIANVSIQGCYGHDMSHFSPDPNHGGGPDSRTHNDVLQSHGGHGTEVIGSTFAAYHDPTIGTLPLPGQVQLAALMINTIIGHSYDLVIEDNWLEGGQYCVNGGGAQGGNGAFRRNQFDHGSAGTGDTTFTLVFSEAFTLDAVEDNVYEDNGHPVQVRIY